MILFSNYIRSKVKPIDVGAEVNSNQLERPELGKFQSRSVRKQKRNQRSQMRFRNSSSWFSSDSFPAAIGIFLSGIPVSCHGIVEYLYVQFGRSNWAGLNLNKNRRWIKFLSIFKKFHLIRRSNLHTPTRLLRHLKILQKPNFIIPQTLFLLEHGHLPHLTQACHILLLLSQINVDTTESWNISIGSAYPTAVSFLASLKLLGE